MTYATTYNIRDYKASRRPKATKAPQSADGVRKLDEKTQGCQRSEKRQATACPGYNASFSFLRTAFLPKLKEDEEVQVCKKAEKMERDFFSSFSYLTDHYDLKPLQTRSFGYPYNMALSLWDTQKQLNEKYEDCQDIRLIQDSKNIYISCTERYNTNGSLYYIPIIPIHRMFEEPQRENTALLLLSVFSYLYNIADIPYYRDENSYLYWQYQMLQDWLIESEYEEEEQKDCIAEFTQAEQIGDYMEQMISNHIHLDLFKTRLDSFEIKDSFDKDCQRLACEAYTIYEKYPDNTIFQNAQPNSETDGYDWDNTISMDRYISFCANDHGWLSETLEQTVNNELQEYGQIEEPTIFKHFNSKRLAPLNLDFENRLFPLLDDLCYVLYHYKPLTK
ncbi:hypothetical protein ACTJJ0_12240 [Chitinophaga sp. 22321]|uniref:PRTRC system protein F n=1 Tax=Chitinophaga hostae TaxID=2831022 RepID=A0ABS5IY08_9BACT|nr:hypothetical protein [Chitinophaga hostae]MBS0027227.1 hypothetical protein [Chitinophaga hostae]